MLLKYSGISFISGAVNHGFFSGERALWTALIGMVLFVLGAWLEHHWHPADTGAPRSGLLKTLALGSLLSIGLGFFTGGLQHFPDSPERSAWVVPLGFFVSVFALGLTAPRSWTRAASTYVLVLGMLTATGSWGALQWLKLHPQRATTTTLVLRAAALTMRRWWRKWSAAPWPCTWTTACVFPPTTWQSTRVKPSALWSPTQAEQAMNWCWAVKRTSVRTLRR